MIKAFLIGYAKFSIAHMKLRFASSKEFGSTESRLATNRRTTEYKFDHSVHLVHSVEKSFRKELFIRESGQRRG